MPQKNMNKDFNNKLVPKWRSAAAFLISFYEWGAPDKLKRKRLFHQSFYDCEQPFLIQIDIRL